MIYWVMARSDEGLVREFNFAASCDETAIIIAERTPPSRPGLELWQGGRMVKALKSEAG